jgi:hypothetical protein
MGTWGVYEDYGALIDDESRLDTLRTKHDSLSAEELAEKLELFQRLGTTGRVYSDIRVTNTTMPTRPAPEEGPDQRRAELRFSQLRERQFDLTPEEGRELRSLYVRFGTQPERYTRSGVTLHIGR